MRKTQSKVKGEQEGRTEEERNQDREVWKSLIQIYIYIFSMLNPKVSEMTKH